VETGGDAVGGRVRGPFLAFLMLLGLSTPAAADMVTFRDPERSIAFSYDDKLWQPSNLPIPRMIFRIERRLLDGKPTAACQLRALRTAFAAVTAGRVHEEREEIVSRILNSIDPSEFEVVSSTSSAITVDSQPMIELRHLIKDRSVNWPFGGTFIMLYTVRAGEEIMLQCDHVGPFERPPEKEGYFESEMRAVMKTLSFDE
jgi:hypothetical protein